jgi:flagellar hook-length control protein FliK
MNTSAFGSVEVRTVVHANDVGLVIGSEKGDLRTLLANEMPAITNTLQQQNLRLNSVNFMQGFAFSNNASGGSDSQQRSFVPLRAPESSQVSEATVNDAMEPRPGGDFGGGRGRLSILA